MTAYIIRRALYTIPLVIGVCLITFLLFEVLYSPELRARRELGRHADKKQIQEIIEREGWDKPLFFNRQAPGFAKVRDTRFADHMTRLLTFHFGRSEKTHEDIGRKIRRGMVPSLTLTVPIFALGLVVSICLSLAVAFFRGTYLDLWVVVICVAFMSVSVLVYILGGQFLLAQHLKLFPIYGYARGINSAKFLLLPVLIALLKGLGGDVRFYRTIFLEQINQDYVRTARAKGLAEHVILLKHVLKNSMIPILTRTVLAIPFLFMGSLLLERFFGIPGLGNMTIEAVESADFKVLSAMVYIGALLFAAGNLATDISYTLVDPRIRFR
ncbi:MAG: ABC transporter permease [Planctomycetes bacterium]|nr:ABC transporter permease [Planctomycetota bacterium]